MDTGIIVGLFTLAGTILGYLVNYGVERLRAKNDKRNYISNVKLDIEIQVYKELSKSFCDMVREINTIIPLGMVTVPVFKTQDAQREYDSKLYNSAVEATINAQNCLRSNIPFIPNEFYEKYNELFQLSRQQLNAFERRWNSTFLGSYEEKSKFDIKEYDRTEEIINKFSELNNQVREYLNNLEVKEK